MLDLYKFGQILWYNESLATVEDHSSYDDFGRNVEFTAFKE
jgi:hypothetical protein